jgi:chromosome segregation ATPase
MSVAGKHVEFGDPGDSFSAATFRKALKGLEIGGLRYAEVQFELKRLLAGVSRRELREVLRRSESIEPLPEYAYREVRRFLEEAIEQDVELQTDPGGVGEKEEELDPVALTVELQKSREALESERTRVREAEEALSDRIVAEEAVRSRLGITLRESERHQAELRAARNSIASRDKVTAQIRQTLDERDAELAAIRREHAELAAALDLHSASGEQLDADLQVLRGQAADAATELAASRDAADKERRKRQEIERALTESNSLNSAARESSASKDKALADMRQALDERDAQLAAMRREHAELAAALDSRSTSGEQLIADLQALRVQAAAAAAELAASRDAVDKERRKCQEIERALTESNSLSSAARESSASKDKALADMRQTLDERDAQLAASRDAADKERRKRQEIERALTESNSLNSAARESLASKDKSHAEMRQTLEERDAQLVARQRELQAALQASEEKLLAAQRRVVGANTDLDGLRAQVANLQARLRDNNALIEKLGASVRSEAERATQWQAAAQQRESEATVTSARAEAMPQAGVLRRAQAAQASAALAKFLSAVRGWGWNIRTAPRPIWIGAAIVLLATVIWFAAHRPSPMPSSPAVSSAAVIQPATTALPTESVEPESVPTETVSAIEAPPHRAATPAARKPVTAGVKLNTDFRRCRAGGIDACYDAIRYRPSDPSLLSALGDALVHANRPADALRAYQRVAILAPNMPGVVAKISALEAKLSAKRASGRGSTHAADAIHNSKAAPQTQSQSH